MSDVTLSDRQAGAARALAEARRQRGINLLDGQPIDNAAVDRAAAEVDALGEADAEATRRDREARARAAADRLAAIAAEILDMEEAGFAALGRAEVYGRLLVDEIRLFYASAASARAGYGRLGKGTPLALTEAEIRRLVGDHLAAVLGTLGLGAPLGSHVRIHPGIATSADAWEAKARKALQHDIDKLKGNLQ